MSKQHIAIPLLQEGTLTSTNTSQDYHGFQQTKVIDHYSIGTMVLHTKSLNRASCCHFISTTDRILYHFALLSLIPSISSQRSKFWPPVHLNNNVLLKITESWLLKINLQGRYWLCVVTISKSEANGQRCWMSKSNIW